MRTKFLVMFLGCVICIESGLALASPLGDAIQKEDVATARQLVEKGANVNEVDGAGYTLLHRSVEIGNLEITQMLIAHHANISSVDSNGNTPLHIAAAKGRRKAVELLLKEKALIDATNKEGNTPLHMAVQEGRVATVEDLLNAGAEKDFTDQQGNTPLHLAAAAGQRKVVEMLIKHHAKVVEQNILGQTPMDLAISEGHAGVVEELLNGGASIDDSEGQSDEEGRPLNNSLSLALNAGQSDIINLVLKKGAAIQARHLYGGGGDYQVRQMGCTPATNLAYQAIVKPRAGAALVKIAGSAFAKAIMCKDKQLLSMMMRRADKIPYGEIAGWLPGFSSLDQLPDQSLINKVFAEDTEMRAHASILFRAYAEWYIYPEQTPGQKQKDYGFLNYLLAKGADASVKDATGNTLLHRAVELGNMKMVKYLLENGAQTNAVTEWGNTPLFRAVLANNSEAVKLLVGHGADVNAANELGNTPLHFAAARNLKEIAALLIKKGANLNVANKDGNTPLHQAVRFPDKFDTAVLLLKRGADIKAQNADGYTALHCAAARDYHPPNGVPAENQGEQTVYYQHPAEEPTQDYELVDLVKEMIKQKADVRTKDKQGKTAYNLALENTSHPGIASYLELPKKKTKGSPDQAKKK